MASSCSDLLNRHWQSSGVDAIPLSEVSETLVGSFGVDGEGINPSGVELAIKGNLGDEAEDLAFACNEALVGYAAEPLAEPDLSAALAAVFLYCECVRYGYGDTEFIFWKAISILFHNQETVDTDVAFTVLRRLVESE